MDMEKEGTNSRTGEGEEEAQGIARQPALEEGAGLGVDGLVDALEEADEEARDDDVAFVWGGVHVVALE